MGNWFTEYFSITRDVRERREKGLHPVDELRRFYILVCCFFCSTTVSITYAFDLFTTDLEEEFGLSAGDLTTVSTVGLVFCYFTIPYGFIYESMGPFILFLVCFFSGGIGSLLMALAFAGKVKGNTATFAVYYAFLNTCSGLIDVAYITTLAELFPRNRGPVIALAKVMTSLGSSALACLSVNIFNDDIISYIYFLMALVMVVSLWAAFTVTLPPYYMNWWRRRGKSEEEIAELEALKPYFEHKFVPKPRLFVGFGIVALLIIFFTIQAPVLAYTTNVSHGGRVAVGVVCILLVLLIFTICLPFRFLGGVDEPAPSVPQIAATPKELEKIEEPVEGFAASGNSLSDDLEVSSAMTVANAEEVDVVGPKRQDPRYEGTILNYLCMPDLWLIFFTFLFQGILGTLVSYNSSSISIAINGYARSRELSALYTAFLGVGSAAGRIALGLFEAYVQSQDPGKRRFVITLALPVPPIMAAISGILILTLPGKAILFPYILVYFENGWSAATNALIFPCLFENNHNFLYNISFAVTMVCIICFNRLMFGMHIDSQERKYRADGSIPATVTGCTLPGCVRMPLIVATCGAAVSSVTAVIVHIRYTRFLRRKRAEGERSARLGTEEADGHNSITDSTEPVATPPAQGQ